MESAIFLSLFTIVVMEEQETPDDSEARTRFDMIVLAVATVILQN